MFGTLLEIIRKTAIDCIKNIRIFPEIFRKI